MSKDLRQAIGAFLVERRESSGGWAPVEERDLKQLYRVIELLIEAKWGADPDGDRPIEITLTDRNRFERPHCLPVPYWHHDHKGHFRACLANLRMASENMGIAVDLKEDRNG